MNNIINQVIITLLFKGREMIAYLCCSKYYVVRSFIDIKIE